MKTRPGRLKVLQTLASDRGFSLIELLAVGAILGIIAIPLVGLFTHSFATTHHGERLTDVTNYCRGKVDETRSEIVNGNNDFIPVAGEVIEVAFSEGTYNGTIIVTYQSTNLYKVVVEATNGAQTVTLRTLVYYAP